MPDAYRHLPGHIVGIACVEHPFRRLNSISGIVSRETDVYLSSWRAPHTRFLASLNILFAASIQPCRVVHTEDGAPKADLIHMPPGFSLTVFSRLPRLAQQRFSELCASPLEWALQVPAPVAHLVVRQRWPSLLHPVPSSRSISYRLFSSVSAEPSADLNLRLPCSSHDYMDPEPLRELLYEVAKIHQDVAPLDDGRRIRLHGLMANARGLVSILDGTSNRSRVGRSGVYHIEK